ncbi:MAG: lysostaphin resistance A-like protein [Bacteroidales bacterium]
MKRDISPWSRVFILIIGTLLMMFVGTITTVIVSLFFAQHSVWSLRIIQLTTIITLFILPAFVVTRLIDGELLNPLSLTIKPKLKGIALITLCILLLQPIIVELANWNSTLELPDSMQHIQEWMRESEAKAEQSLKILLQGDDITSYLINIIIVSIMAGFGEELFFRGLLQNKLSSISKRPILSALMVAILFSALHLQFFGFFPRALLGALFGIFLIFGQSIWYPIYAHSLHNAIGVTSYYLVQRGMLEENQLERLGGDNHQLIFLVSTILLSIMLLFTYRKYIHKRTNES